MKKKLKRLWALLLCMLTVLDVYKRQAYKGCKIAATGDFETITFADEPERQPGFLIKAYEVEFFSQKKNREEPEKIEKSMEQIA